MGQLSTLVPIRITDDSDEPRIDSKVLTTRREPSRDERKNNHIYIFRELE
jgi:hypothetical protein